jgi:hypothetical protein
MNLNLIHEMIVIRCNLRIEFIQDCELKKIFYELTGKLKL